MGLEDVGIRATILGLAEFRRGTNDMRYQLNQLAGATGLAGSQAVGLGTRLTSLGSNISRIGQTLTYGLTLPLVALGGGLVAAGIQFEDAFAGVSKTVDGISDDFGNLTKDGEKVRQQFRELALEIPISVNELARIGELGGQLGITRTELTEFTKTVALLGVTTEMTSEEAATFFARLGNIMGIAASDMAEFTKQAGSTVVDLGNKFAATEPEIAALSLRLAGAAQVAGYSTPQVLALATALASVGVHAEMGGSALSRIILEIKRAADNFTATGGEVTDQMKLFAQAAEMSVDQFVAMQKNDPLNVLLRVVSGFNRMQQSGQLTNDMLAEMNFDTVRLQDVLNRLGPNIALVNQAVGVANVEWKEQNALQIEAQKRFNTVKSQIILMKNAFVDLGIELFDMYSKDIVNIVKGIRGMFNAFKDLDDGTKKLIVTIGLLAAALGPVMVFGGTVLQIFGLLITMFASTGLVFGGLAAVVGAFAIAWESDFKGIQTISTEVLKTFQDIFYWLGKAFEYGKKVGGNLFYGIGAAFKALTYVYKDNKRTFFSNVLKAFGLGQEEAEKLGMAFRNKLAPTLMKLSDGFNAIGYWFNRFKEDIQTSGLAQAILNIFTPVLDLGEKGIISPFEHILRAFGMSYDSIFKLRAAFDVFINDTLPKLGEFAKSVVILFGTIVVYIIQNVLPVIHQLVYTFVNTVLPALLPVLTDITKALTDLWVEAEPSLTDLLNWMKDEAIPKFGKFLAEKLLPAIDDIVKVIDKLSPIIGPLLPYLGLLWLGFTILGPAVTGLNIAFGLITTAIGLLTGPLLLLLLPLAIGAGLIYLYLTNTWGFKDAIDSIIPRLETWGGTFEDIKTIVKWIANNAGRLLSNIVFEIPFGLKQFADLVRNIEEGMIRVGLLDPQTQGVVSGGEFPGLKAQKTKVYTGNIFAAGGPINRPGIVGDRGPELFIPGRAGYILDNLLTNRLMNGSFGNTYNIQNIFSPSITGANISSDQGVGNEIAKQYRLASLSV